MNKKTSSCKSDEQSKCIFCSKSRAESVNLVGTGDFFICDSCIQLCSSLIHNINPEVEPAAVIENDLLNPILIRQYLDKFVVGQEEAKIALSVSVANHYKRMLYSENSSAIINKSNLIITGPSGSGKSLLIESIAHFLNVPFITVDATTLTEAGYIGENVDTIISRLLIEADGDIDKAECGIVFIDEIDKIATGKNRTSTSDNRVSGVQSALLKMVEGSIIRIPLNGTSKRPTLPQIVEVNTKNILFICGGAFFGMNEIVKSRMKTKQGLGFLDTVTPSTDLGSKYTTEDFINFGIIPEFIGRFPLKTRTTELSIDELVKILSVLDNNILNEFKFYFNIDGIELDFTPGFIHKIAELAKKEKTGARGLRTLCESVIQEHMYLIPEYKTRNISKMTFDENCIINNTAPKIELYENKLKKS